MELSNKKTVLVTGSAGFIGLNTVKEYIKAGWQIYALVHHNVPDSLNSMENVHIIKGDVTSKEFALSINGKFDVIAHIAGLASDIGSDKKFRKINFEPVTFLADMAVKKFIYVSSSDVYGIKDFNNADENTPLLEFPKNPYPKYKIKSENWLRENCKKPYVIIRPAAVYGEGDKTLERRFLSFLKFSPFIVHFGKWKGKNRWPLANVQNVAKTIVAVSEFNEYDYQAINIIDTKKTTLDEYYRQLAQKYFPQKHYKTITLPMFAGKVIGYISTFLSNIFGLKHPLFDPTFYAVHHVSSNLDFSSEKMENVIKLYNS